MTETEVESLLGGKGSKAASLPLVKGETCMEAWTDPTFQGRHETLRLREWRTPDKCLKVGFDTNGRAVYAIVTTCMSDMTLWQKLRWWSGF